MPIKALRTPDACFDGLPGWQWAPRYLDTLPGYEGLRVAYVDEGPRDAAHVFLCLHGQPTWSYLYRRMIPPLLATGARVIAPDLLGFGRSDKPVDDAVYTYEFHRGMLAAFVRALDLERITLLVQDWGGLLGLTLPPEMPERFERLIIMNTAFATGDVPVGPGFLAWREWNAKNPDMNLAALMKRSTPHLTDAEAAAYAAPFPDASYKAGVRRFPNLVPLSPDEEGAARSRAAREWWRTQWSGRSFMAIGVADPVIGREPMRALHAHIRDCPPPFEIAEAGHFVQEWGEQVVAAALASFGGR
jgi:pimeloyl-ACP methyl ester carboxylesterase